MSEVLDRLKAALADRYAVERELGSGGMAVVYLAQDLRHERPVAIKVLRPELTSVVAAERFLREIKLTAALAHPHILPVHDSGEAEGFLYYVMPYVEGESLREKLNREKQLPVDEAVRIAREVADALSYAHEQKLLHRDIKPENILLEAGHAVVADFGIARALSEAAGDRLTDTGISIGTPAYMSPEQAAGEREIGEGSDLYSLACVLYEMLTGEPPISDPSVRKVVSRKILGDFRAVRDIRREVPAEVDTAVSRALATEPADRFASAGEFAGDLGATVRAEQGDGSKRRWALWAAVSVVALLGGLIWYVGWGRSSGPVADSKSIAVLPLENLSGDEQNEAFTNGVHDVILTDLYKIADLRPISRTSVMEYRDTRKNIRQIAEELGVATVLEGGVQRAGDRVLVNVQLIDAQRDRHIWAEMYDRELTVENIFAIQVEIAQHIATALRAEITAEEDERLAGLPTDNPEAYDYYLSGEEYRRRGSREDFKIAKEMFKSAIALDPEFALAYARLAEAHLRVFGSTQAPSPTAAALDSAKAAAERALELHPDLPEAHVALGRCYWHLGDDDRAMQHYAVARRLSPNDGEVWSLIGVCARAQGEFEEALTNLKRAAELSPRETSVLVNLGTTYMLLRRYQEAEACLDRAIALAPDRGPYYWKAFVALNQRGGAERAWQATQEAREKTRYESPFWGADRYRHRAFLRIFHDRIRDELRTYALDRPFYSVDYFLSKAISYELDDEVELSPAYYDSARADLESLVQSDPESAFLRQNLGIAYAGLGRAQEAVREGKAAVELTTPTPVYAVNRPSMLWSLSEIYIMIEDYEAAIEQLELVLSVPGIFSAAILKLDPLWDPLRDHPRFQALLERYEQ